MWKAVNRWKSVARYSSGLIVRSNTFATNIASQIESTIPRSTANAIPFRVCIVGSGPAGFYTAKYLLSTPRNTENKNHNESISLKSMQINVDMIEALPTPFGLVRSGVAPDHPEVKSVENDFNLVAQDERFQYLGNVEVGKELPLQELCKHYDAIVLAYGASSDKELNIPGEKLASKNTVLSTRAFVNWYNGHPAYRDLEIDLSKIKTVVIVGQGNVALDCARILMKDITELKPTDITSYATDILSKSSIKKVILLGRRGSVQTACTIKELRELTKLQRVSVVVSPDEIAASQNLASIEEVKEHRATKRLSDLLAKISTSYDTACTADKSIEFKFFSSPVEIHTDPISKKVVGLTIERNVLQGDSNHQRAIGTGKTSFMPCDLVLRSVGYKSVPLGGSNTSELPFDNKRNILPNIQGRIINDSQCVMSGLYCVGWVKRGPSGIIGSNILDAKETVGSILEDFRQLQFTEKKKVRGLEGIKEYLGKMYPHKRLVDWKDVENIHFVEKSRGEKIGKSKEKVTTVDEMLKIIE